MLKITSRENQRLKKARKVRDGHIKDSIFIEGSRLVFEALKSNIRFSEVFISENFFSSKNNESVVKELESNNVGIFIVSEKLLKTLSDTKNAQGIVAVCETPTNGRSLIESKFNEKNSGKSIILLLHEINNPSNLGAILRTAEAAGVLGIVTTKSSAKVFSPKALRGAMGASFRLAVWENAGFDEAINWARSKKLKSICADINAKRSYLDLDWNDDYLLVFGSEAHGLSEAEKKLIDQDIFIPMENGVESLNLAVACGIILFTAKNY